MATGISKANGRQSKSNENFFKRYAQEQRSEVNKAKRLSKYLEKAPWDRFAHEALSKLSLLVLNKAGVKVPQLEENTTQYCARNKITRTQHRKDLKEKRLSKRNMTFHLEKFDTAMAVN